MWWGKFPPHINSVWQQPTCICTASPWLRHLLNTSSVAHYFIILCTRRAVRVTRCHRPRRAPAEMFRRYKWKTKLKKLNWGGRNYWTGATNYEWDFLLMRGFMICFYILQSWYYDRRDCEKWLDLLDWKTTDYWHCTGTAEQYNQPATEVNIDRS